jgi:hypothetical protein
MQAERILVLYARLALFQTFSEVTFALLGSIEGLTRSYACIFVIKFEKP